MKVNLLLLWSDENPWLRTSTTSHPDFPDREGDKTMVTVIFFGIMLLGLTFMALRSRRHDRLHGGKLREAPVYRRPDPRPEDWPAA